MRFQSFCILLTFFSAMSSVLGSTQESLTESHVVLIALQRNKEIQRLVLDRTADSLDLNLTRSQWLPIASLDGSISQRLVTDKGDPTTGSASLTLGQSLPGGTNVLLNFSHKPAEFSATSFDSSERPVSTITTRYTSSYGAQISQPLLAGAWKNDRISRENQIQDFSHRIFSINQKRRIAATLSQSRSLYWRYYKTAKICAISRSAVGYTENQMNRHRIRFLLGEASVLDTLNASLESLSAQEAYLTDSMSAARARNDLSRNLDISTDSFVLLPDDVIVIPVLPRPDSLIAEVHRYDPQAKIFDLLRLKLESQYQQRHTALLPDLKAVASYGNTFADSRQSFAENALVSLVFSYHLPSTNKKNELMRTGLQIKNQLIDEAEHTTRLRDSLSEFIDAWHLESKKVSLSIIARNIAQQSFDASVKGYELGTIDRLSYLKAQNDLIEKSIHAINQQIAMKFLEISLDEITGTVFTKFGVSLP